MYSQGQHSRSGSSTRPATTIGGADTTSDVSNMLRKYKIVILGEQSSKGEAHSGSVIIIILID